MLQKTNVVRVTVVQLHERYSLKVQNDKVEIDHHD